MKGKKVTLKILQAECFAGTLRDGLSRKALSKCNWHLTLQLPACASHMPVFIGTFTRELLVS